MIALRDAFAAQPDDDFDLPAVVRRKAPAQPRRARSKPQRKVGLGERMMSFALRRPRQILAALVLAGCGGAIAWNALVMQSTRHPAPMFNRMEPEVEAEVEYEYEPVLSQPAPPTQPLPPARPDSGLFEPHPLASAEPPASRSSSRSAIADMIRNGGAPASAKATHAPAAVAAPTRERAPTVRDPIGEIIRLGGPVPVPPANVGRTDAGDLVLSGQRALARLGYRVTVDGIMGSETRQAIERFEQDRRLPVTGAFSSRTVRELSAESGIAVQ